MANEKRLVNAEAIARKLKYAHCSDCHVVRKIQCSACWVGDVLELLEGDAVDAVEVEKYNALLEKYNDLRENFVDYVCSGIRNEAPYCLNKCETCVDKRGWCKLERCQGFNPAECLI